MDNKYLKTSNTYFDPKNYLNSIKNDDKLNTFNNPSNDLISSGRTVNKNNQRFFNMHKFVKNPTERFMPDYSPNTGVNHKKNFQILMEKQVIKPYTNEKVGIYQQTLPNLDSRKNKYSLNISLKCPEENLLPKYQQYKVDYFPSKTEPNDDTFSRNIKTDHISLKIPKLKENKGSFLEMKGRFNPNTESKSSYVPYPCTKCICNNSSVNYNIISMQGKDGFADNTAGVLEPKLFFRKKEIGHYKDLTQTYAVNPNRIYIDTLNNSPKSFRHYNGIFTHLYDSAVRNGNLILPFKKSKK